MRESADPALIDLLQCPRCGGRPHQKSARELVCESCGAAYPVDRGVPLMWARGSRSSQLEKIDYEALQPVNPDTIKQVYRQWEPVLARAGGELGDVLEIGAGPGILTDALLTHSNARSLTASDVSLKFMRVVEGRFSGRSHFRGAVVCDANEVAFREGSFDKVVGRSILHHLIDYPIVLSNVRSMLRPGGAALFFEPVLEGKALVSLAFALILQFCESTSNPSLSRADLDKIRRVMRHQTKHAWYPQTRDELAKIEDKYIFRIADLQKRGRELGYSDVEFVDSQFRDESYWAFIAHTLRMAGVDAKAIESFQWIGRAIKESYFRSTYSVPSPMVFFLFRR